MNISKMIFATGAALALAGCASYTGAVMPGDDITDEGNREFAQKAAEAYAARQQFRRPVVIQEAEGVNLFLSPGFVPRSNDAQATALCQNIEVRRTMLQSAKARLRDIVGGLSDLQLTGDAQQEMVSISADQGAVQNVYRITYNISGLDLQLRSHKSIIDNKLMYDWVANVSAEVRMIAPDGKDVFTFNAMETVSENDDGSLRPNATMLEQCATKAIASAMRQYGRKFGPPIYVTDTCQNGEYARINVGSSYGVQAGMKIEFFRHREKKGLSGDVEMAEQRVATGTVGQGGAPVEPTHAWVHVDSYDEKSRGVYQWTSARILEGEGSTSALQIPGFN